MRLRINHLLLFTFLFNIGIFSISTLHAQEAAPSDDEMTEEEFRSKLSDMFNRLNKSIKLIRDQITENQSAPFLANLYMQLGDMLTQKANVQYYIKNGIFQR
jgi:hypothetical protein